MSANLSSKLEAAAAALATNALAGAGYVPGTNVLVATGKSSATKDTVPLVICEAVQGPEDPVGSGNFDMELTVAVESAAAIDANGVDPKPADDLLIGTIFNAFLSSTLPSDLNTVGVAVTVMGIYDRDESSGVSGDVWRNELKMRCYCAPSTLFP